MEAVETAPAGTSEQPAGTAATITPAGPAKPAKVTAKLNLVVEYTTDVDEAKAYSVGVVKSLRDAGLTVKAEFVETQPSKRSL